MKITIRTMWAIDPQFPTNSPPTYTLTYTLPLDPIRAQDGAAVNFYAMWRNHRGRVVHIVRPAFSRLTVRRRWRITMAPQASKPPSRTNSSPATAAPQRQCSSRDIPVGAAGRICTGPTLANLTLKDLQSISGSLLITFQGSTWPEPITYSAPIILSGVPSFAAAAKTIESALNSNLPVAAYTSESSITPTSVSFTGSITGDLLQITSVSSGSIELGAEISGPGGIPIGAQIVTQRAGTPGGPGLYTLFAKAGTFSSETMTETYGVLTVGSVIPARSQSGRRLPAPAFFR